MIKGPIIQEDIIILNIHAPNSVRVYEAKTELQRKLDEFSIIIGDFNTPPSEMNRSSRKKISKNIVELNSTINHLDIIDI